MTSFGLGMNEDFWTKLPPDLKKLVTDTVTGKEAEVGQAWDGLDVPGKKAVIDGGGEAIQFSAAEMDKVRKIGADVSEAKIKEYEGKGMPARASTTTMRPAVREARQDLEELLELKPRLALNRRVDRHAPAAPRGCGGLCSSSPR